MKTIDTGTYYGSDLHKLVLDGQKSHIITSSAAGHIAKTILTDPDANEFKLMMDLYSQGGLEFSFVQKYFELSLDRQGALDDFHKKFYSNLFYSYLLASNKFKDDPEFLDQLINGPYYLNMFGNGKLSLNLIISDFHGMLNKPGKISRFIITNQILNMMREGSEISIEGGSYLHFDKDYSLSQIFNSKEAKFVYEKVLHGKHDRSDNDCKSFCEYFDRIVLGYKYKDINSHLAWVSKIASDEFMGDYMLFLDQKMSGESVDNDIEKGLSDSGISQSTVLSESGAIVEKLTLGGSFDDLSDPLNQSVTHQDDPLEELSFVIDFDSTKFKGRLLRGLDTYLTTYLPGFESGTKITAGHLVKLINSMDGVFGLTYGEIFQLIIRGFGWKGGFGLDETAFNNIITDIKDNGFPYDKVKYIDSVDNDNFMGYNLSVLESDFNKYKLYDYHYTSLKRFDTIKDFLVELFFKPTIVTKGTAHMKKSLSIKVRNRFGHPCRYNGFSKADTFIKICTNYGYDLDTLSFNEKGEIISGVISQSDVVKGDIDDKETSSINQDGESKSIKDDDKEVHILDNPLKCSDEIFLKGFEIRLRSFFTAHVRGYEQGNQVPFDVFINFINQNSKINGIYSIKRIHAFKMFTLGLYRFVNSFSHKSFKELVDSASDYFLDNESRSIKISKGELMKIDLGEIFLDFTEDMSTTILDESSKQIKLGYTVCKYLNEYGVGKDGKVSVGEFITYISRQSGYQSAYEYLKVLFKDIFKHNYSYDIIPENNRIGDDLAYLIYEIFLGFGVDLKENINKTNLEVVVAGVTEISNYLKENFDNEFMSFYRRVFSHGLDHNSTIMLKGILTMHIRAIRWKSGKDQMTLDGVLKEVYNLPGMMNLTFKEKFIQVMRGFYGSVNQEVQDCVDQFTNKLFDFTGSKGSLSEFTKREKIEDITSLKFYKLIGDFTYNYKGLTGLNKLFQIINMDMFDDNGNLRKDLSVMQVKEFVNTFCKENDLKISNTFNETLISLADTYSIVLNSSLLSSLLAPLTEFEMDQKDLVSLSKSTLLGFFERVKKLKIGESVKYYDLLENQVRNFFKMFGMGHEDISAENLISIIKDIDGLHGFSLKEKIFYYLMGGIPRSVNTEDLELDSFSFFYDYLKGFDLDIIDKKPISQTIISSSDDTKLVDIFGTSTYSNILVRHMYHRQLNQILIYLNAGLIDRGTGLISKNATVGAMFGAIFKKIKSLSPINDNFDLGYLIDAYNQTRTDDVDIIEVGFVDFLTKIFTNSGYDTNLEFVRFEDESGDLDKMLKSLDGLGKEVEENLTVFQKYSGNKFIEVITNMFDGLSQYCPDRNGLIDKVKEYIIEYQATNNITELYKALVVTINNINILKGFDLRTKFYLILKKNQYFDENIFNEFIEELTISIGGFRSESIHMDIRLIYEDVLVKDIFGAFRSDVHIFSNKLNRFLGVLVDDKNYEEMSMQGLVDLMINEYAIDPRGKTYKEIIIQSLNSEFGGLNSDFINFFIDSLENAYVCIDDLYQKQTIVDDMSDVIYLDDLFMIGNKESRYISMIDRIKILGGLSISEKLSIQALKNIIDTICPIYGFTYEDRLIMILGNKKSSRANAIDFVKEFVKKMKSTGDRFLKKSLEIKEKDKELSFDDKTVLKDIFGSTPSEYSQELEKFFGILSSKYYLTFIDKKTNRLNNLTINDMANAIKGLAHYTDKLSFHDNFIEFIIRYGGINEVTQKFILQILSNYGFYIDMDKYTDKINRVARYN